jgi:S1-C subfamily serine protease
MDNDAQTDANSPDPELTQRTDVATTTGPTEPTGWTVPAEPENSTAFRSAAPPAPEPTWGWTAPKPAGAPSFEFPAPPVQTSEPTEAVPRRGTGRSAFIGGIVGALVGALVAGGLVVAFDDDPSATQTIVRTEAGDARPATSLESPGDIREIVDVVRPGVVRIEASGDLGEGTGTGFIIDADGIIVTNAHVVAGADQVTVRLADGDELTGDVVGSAAQFDLAVVRVIRTGLPTLELGDSDDLQVGDAVVAIGNALDLSEGSGATVTTGIVSGLDRTVAVETEVLVNAIQTDAAINPGNSGGPLVDTRGRVVGINSAIASPETANNVGFAIAISDARPVVDELLAGRDPRIAFLGVLTEPVTPTIVSEFDLSVGSGALVIEVTEDTAAEDAGILQDDVIVAVSGQQVDGPEDVARAVRRHQPGDEVEVVLLRDGERESFTVTLRERPDDF